MPFYQFKCDKCEHKFEERIHLDGSDPPEHYVCPECGNEKAPREYWTEDSMPGGFMKGVCDRKMREMKRFNVEGYNKQQAENFYKESIEASKERMKTGGQHYKEVMPDLKHHLKHGMIKINDDKKKANLIDKYKSLGSKILDVKSGKTKK